MLATHDVAFRIVATNPRLRSLSQNVIKQLGKNAKKASLHKLAQWPSVGWPAHRGTSPLLVVSSLADIPEKPPLPSDEPGRRHLVFTEGLPPEASTRILKLNVRNVHLAAEQGDAQEELLRRLFRGCISPGDFSIVDAWWEKAEFVVLSADYARLRIPATKLAPWLGSADAKLEKFELDPDGSFVYWRHANAHFGWEQLRYLIDPAAVAAAQQRSRDSDVRYGAAIRDVRVAHLLSQLAIPGVSERHVRRVEKGLAPATSKFLKLMATAHRLNIACYLDEVARRLK